MIMSSDDDASARMTGARHALVETLDQEIARLGADGDTHALDPRVRQALLKVPREHFVPEHQRAQAYDNRPLPIGHDQTISQPFVVAVMTHHLRLAADARVLEVGTGSGYQTALLAELASEVVTIEVVEPLAARARDLLERLGYPNVVFRTGDGAAGAPELAPFDGIVVTAAARSVPKTLVEQLAPGGRMVIPAEEAGSSNFFMKRLSHGQDLLLVEKDATGEVSRRALFPVAFVPLTGEHR